jgi:hypothetical protein
MVEEVIRHYKTSCNIKKELVLIKAPALFVKRRFLSAIIEKRLFLTGRTGQHHPRRQAQSSVRLSAHEATAHNLHFSPWPSSSESAARARRRPTSGLPTNRTERLKHFERWRVVRTIGGQRIGGC